MSEDQLSEDDLKELEAIDKVVRRKAGARVESFGDNLSQWAVNTVQVIVALLVVGFGVTVAFFYFSPASYIDIYGADNPLTPYLARCGSIEEELQADYACTESSDCMLNREELTKHVDRVAKHTMFCTEE